MKLILSSVFLIYSTISFGISASTTSGIKYPQEQIFIDKKDNASLHVQCHEISKIEIECNIAEVGIVHKNTDSDKEFLTSIKNNDKDFKTEKKHFLDGCSKIEKLDTKSTPSKQEQKTIAELKNLCVNPTNQNFINLVENMNEQRKQTCTMTADTYTQKFQFNRKTGNWSWNDTQPYGMCGVIQAGYFKKDNTVKNIDSWNYTMKSVYTNNTGYFCSKVHDTNVNYYGIMSLKHYNGIQKVNCKYIDFAQTVVIQK